MLKITEERGRERERESNEEKERERERRERDEEREEKPESPEGLRDKGRLEGEARGGRRRHNGGREEGTHNPKACRLRPGGFVCGS